MLQNCTLKNGQNDEFGYVYFTTKKCLKGNRKKFQESLHKSRNPQRSYTLKQFLWFE